ncbi:hypothetical protein ACSNOK_29205 [Streptomyces sp. URMC 126]|uniref:hypothetical protein n=1 Tax=Streptomyces sp. URMC 126 TaxID=3423401 RepID=UPI003F1B2D4C
MGRAAVGAVVGAAAVAAVPAAAADAGSASPFFLEARELPPVQGAAWTAGPVSAGVPDPLPFCVGAALPAATARHRVFRTDLDAGATQVTVVERDAARAKTLAALWDTAVRACAARTEKEEPGTTARWKDFGAVDAEDGARVYGVHTARPSGSSDVHLFAVGRDGRTVTVVTWGRLGRFEDAPVAGFKATARTAVNKLYPDGRRS